MAKAEKMLAILLAIGILFKILRWDGGDIFTLISGILLSILYFPFGFALLSGIRLRQLFTRDAYANRKTEHTLLAGAAGMVFSISCVAIVFCLLHWGGGVIMRFISLGGLLLIIGLVVVLRDTLNVPGGWRSWLLRALTMLSLLVASGYPPLSIPRRLDASASSTKTTCFPLWQRIRQQSLTA